jgi:cytochrome c oxidase cbb3-type subunit 4
METYSFLRELADSWVLLGMFAFFIGAGIWAFLPSQASAREDASMIPFRNETAGCSNKCADCNCDNDTVKLRGPSNEK